MNEVRIDIPRQVIDLNPASEAVMPPISEVPDAMEQADVVRPPYSDELDIAIASLCHQGRAERTVHMGMITLHAFGKQLSEEEFDVFRSTVQADPRITSVGKGRYIIRDHVTDVKRMHMVRDRLFAFDLRLRAQRLNGGDYLSSMLYAWHKSGGAPPERQKPPTTHKNHYHRIDDGEYLVTHRR